MELQISAKTTVATGSFGNTATDLAMRLEGKRNWLRVGQIAFETTQHNISLLLSLHPNAEIKDNRPSSVFDEKSKVLRDPEPRFVMKPHDFQLRNFERFKNQKQWAIFSEQGTGKTKVAIDIICHRYLKCTVTGVIILSSPKGVHAQWVNDQFPKHVWEGVKTKSYIWDGKPPSWIGRKSDELQIFSGNIDMLKSKGYDALDEFARVHKHKLLILVDESDSIKNISAQRSRKVRELGHWTEQHAIMTGTPIAKDLTDEWAQFFFLNPEIIGNKYLTSFRAQYCVMGGFQNRSVVGHRNIDRFKDLVSPYIFRATKDELNLPPKVYDEVVFDLEPEQKTMIRSIRDTFFADLGKHGELSVKNGATALLRIQQISNGFAVNEDKTIVELKNPRLDALVQLRRDLQGKIIVWCRFQQDVQYLLKKFENSVSIYGSNSDDERSEAKEEFISGVSNLLIATPGAAGKGIDGLQRVCTNAIYYSNSFNAIDRWQSEDRIHRIGMSGTASYFDLVARGSIDRSILSNLQKKKDISSLALDDMIKIMEEL